MNASVSVGLQAKPFSKAVMALDVCDINVRRVDDGQIVTGSRVSINPDDTATASFDLPDGTYKVSAHRVSFNDGGPIGTPAESEPFTIVNMHDIKVPVTVTVTVG
jgi:hypothetical protein